MDTNKKEYLVDVPVQVNIWVREDCQRRQFEVIKLARPSIIILTSDGGRNEDEWAIIKKHRLMYEEEIDWNCTLYKLYEDENNGLYAMIKKTHEFVWKLVDRCILLEDDILPSVSFFKYCAELLEKYKDDTRINMICGMNILGTCEHVNSDYFFSKQGSIWGIATWRRFYEQFYDFEYKNDEYVMNCLYDFTRSDKEFRKRYLGYASDANYAGHPAAIEFFVGFGVYGQNQLQIIPKKNLIANIGCSEQASHSDSLKRLPKKIRRMFNMKTYEIDFPLKHAKYVINDRQYERKRNSILAYNHPVIQKVRLVERFLLVAKSGDFSYLFSKLKKYIVPKKTIEK